MPELEPPRLRALCRRTLCLRAAVVQGYLHNGGALARDIRFPDRLAPSAG